MAAVNQEKPSANAPQPKLNVLKQYLKDLSFENVNAPDSLRPSAEEPEVSIQVHVSADQINPNQYEVLLKIAASANSKAGALFRADVDYAGVFELLNIPEADLHAVIMIECPRLLFPYARQIVSESVRGGGFPPLMLEPIDFVALYRERLDEVKRAQETEAAEADAGVAWIAN